MHIYFINLIPPTGQSIYMRCFGLPHGRGILQRPAQSRQKRHIASSDFLPQFGPCGRIGLGRAGRTAHAGLGTAQETGTGYGLRRGAGRTGRRQHRADVLYIRPAPAGQAINTPPDSERQYIRAVPYPPRGIHYSLSRKRKRSTPRTGNVDRFSIAEEIRPSGRETSHDGSYKRHSMF